MSFKIAYCAGHYLGTSGKRVPKKLDPAQTREWTLNDRVARFFAEAAAEYEDVELLRTDDATGKKDISIKNRTKKANEWGANIYLDMHHNAGIHLGKGGGAVVISKKNDTSGEEYREAIYEAVIAAGGLKGNRSNPTYAKNFLTMVYTKMTAIIIEYGFMDSKTDYPIISTEEYAKKVAYATMEAVAKVAGLNKKVAVENTSDVSEKDIEMCKVEAAILRRGDKNNSVVALQHLLIGYGFEMKSGSKIYGADGSYGPATENAVIAFQKSRNLEEDGVCGPKTWAKLLGL